MFGLESPDTAKVLIAAIGAFPLLVATMWGRDKIKKSKPPVGEDIVEIKGAIIDNRKADAIIDEMQFLGRRIDAHGNKLEANTNSCDRMQAELRDMKGEIGDLITEFKVAARVRGIGQ